MMALRTLASASVLSLAAGVSALTAGQAVAASVHEHGTARLQAVLSGPTLTLSLKSPLVSLVGFERPPKNNRQRAALLYMEERLQAADTLFQPDPAAGCRLKDVRLAHPYQAARKSARVHSDIDVRWTFTCKDPDALKQIEVQLFDGFPGLRQLQAQTTGPGGRGAARLDKTNRWLVFSRPKVA